MAQVNIRDLRKDIGRYLDRAASGEEIVITRKGKAVAKLVANTPKVDLSDMDDFYDSYDYEETGNAVVEAREDYRY